MKQLALLFAILVGMMLIAAWLRKGDLSLLPTLKSSPPAKTYNQIMKVKDVVLNVEIAQTTEELEQGLAGRAGIEQDQGMLFVVAQNSRPAFWMKGMKFPIDIVWINDGTVIGFVKNLPAPQTSDTTELQQFVPPVAVDYVLETKAGFLSKHGIIRGNPVQLPPGFQ